jgi:hypothetical protein
MANRIVDRFTTTGQTHVYLYPYRSRAGVLYSLADWATHRVAFAERASPNLGHYVSGNCDDSKGLIWAIFDLASDTQPSDWSLATEFANLGQAAMGDLDIDNYDLTEAMRILLAVNAGKVSGGSTATNIIRAADDSKARITATVDSNGNRTSLTLDATP